MGSAGTRHSQLTNQGSPEAPSRAATWLSLSLPNDLTSVQRARKQMRSLRGRIPERILPDAILLTNELITNSLRHSGALLHDPIQLVVVGSERRVRVEVIDRGAGFAGPSGRPGGYPGGWGLQLVAKLAERWGSVTMPGGGFKVWFEMSLDT